MISWHNKKVRTTATHSIHITIIAALIIAVTVTTIIVIVAVINSCYLHKSRVSLYAFCFADDYSIRYRSS